MTIKQLKKFLDEATKMLEVSIESHDTNGTIEGRDERQQMIGQLQALNYLKKQIK